jgi:hypothetical protein
MTSNERMRTIEKVEATAPASLVLAWSDGVTATVDLTETLKRPAFASIRDAKTFEAVELGDWGHSVAWPSGVELGADRLWLDTLSSIGKGDARTFLEWRIRHGLSLTKAAEALGISRRIVAYYSNGEKPAPRHILLACLGWEAETDKAA